MSLKGLYISNIDMNNKSDGVVKKINNHINCFRNNGIDINYAMCNFTYDTDFGQKLLSRLPFFDGLWSYDNIKLDNLDFLYIRGAGINKTFINFLKIARNKVKKIILEIPTYPYEGELKDRWQKYPYYLKDLYNRKKLYKYIDLIYTTTKEKTLFNVPVVYMQNFANYSLIELKKEAQHSEDEIHLVAVAGMYLWHGYTRVLQGLANYYKTKPKTKIFVHLVGEGSETPLQKKIVKENNLKEYCIFYGRKTGNEIKEIIDNCDIGLCSFSCYLKNCFHLSELKSLEYAAYGLPILSALKLDQYDGKEVAFVKYYPNNDTPIDLTDVPSWYNNLIKNHNGKHNLNQYIRDFSKPFCDVNYAFKPIIDVVKSME